MSYVLDLGFTQDAGSWKVSRFSERDPRSQNL